MTIQETIEKKLKQNFPFVFLDLINESPQHNVPPGSESHFKLVIVSPAFIDQTRVKRHQMIYQVLSQEMKLIHALSLHTYTPDEWANHTGVPSSPICRGGSAK
jgi:BolA protein